MKSCYHPFIWDARISTCCFSFQVSSILNGMLDQSFRERTVRKQQGAKLVTAVLRNWRKLDSWWAKGSSPESKMAILTLLAKVLQVRSFPSRGLIQMQSVNLKTEQPLIKCFVMFASRNSQWRSSTHINRLQKDLYFKDL